ncbi:MAG: TrkA family potassium uptake protein [Bacteroidales bacterium]|jgi:trk system potassium uptake protein TrkA|nr:TrkA family potassium uptake protein [Bacteroidales bacterium]
MKYIVIGLGHFGAVLSEKLTAMGHEVIGVDIDPQKVEDLKQTVATTIALDSRDQNALNVLPLKDADTVFVTIGEDFGASIHIIALLKQHKVKRLVGRAVSPLHKTVMEAIGVDEIIMPEQEYAGTYASRIEVAGASDVYIVDDQSLIAEIPLPAIYVGQTVKDIHLNENFSLMLIAIKRNDTEKNLLGATRQTKKLLPKFDDQTPLQEKDVLLVFGKIGDIKKFESM